MAIVINILFGIIAAYFLAAAFIPKIRSHWGVSKGIDWTFSKSGVTRESYSKRLPRMGVISCLGFSLFFGGMIFGFGFKISCIGGLILIAIGAVRDWLREPPVTTRKRS